MEVNERICKILVKKYEKKENEKECLKEVKKFLENNDSDSLIDNLSSLFGISEDELIVIASECSKIGKLSK
jgi:hypothetical protein